MEQEIVLGRIGHYHDAGNGSCSTAIVVGVITPGGEPAVQGVSVNVQAWHHGGEPFERTSVPVDSPPEEARNSFHLNRDCPWGR